MPILINDNTARVQYTATAGQTVFIVPYEFFETGDLKVYNGDTLLTYNVSPSSASQYSVAGAGVTGGGSITLGAPGAALGSIITIVRDIPIERVTDFPNAGPFNIQALNSELDKITAVQQNLETDLDNRVLRLGDSDTPNTLSAIPNKASRQNKLLGFDVQGQPVAYDSASLATLVAYATAFADTFTGNGSNTTFTLSGDPAVIANLDVSINGLTQVPLTDYTLSGTTLTTTTPVPNGAVMLVKYKEGLPNYSGDAQDIQYNAGFTGAVQQSVEAKLEQYVSVKDFGAVGDGVTDDTAAIQAAIDYAIQNGVAVYFPGALYRTTSELFIDRSFNNLDPTQGGRYGITLRGDGAAASIIASDHAGNCLRFLGGASAGWHTQFVIDGLCLTQPDNAQLAGSIGLYLDQAAYVQVRDFDLSWFEYGLYCVDVLSSNFSDGTIRLNEYGFKFQKGTRSHPNNISFNGITVLNNQTYGGYLVKPSEFNFFGGSIESNGYTGVLADTNSWGLYVDQPGTEGSVGVNLNGVYIENNNGKADVWIVATGGTGATTSMNTFTGCSFLRFSNTRYVTNCILIDGANASRVTVSGCGFKDYAPYVSAAGRLWIAAANAQVFDGGGNLFYDTAGGFTGISRSVFAPIAAHHQLPFASLPTASLFPNGIQYCADGGGGTSRPSIAVSDGTKWWQIVLGQFGGSVQSGGTANTLPRGWSVSTSGTGIYTITHNLGITGTQYSVTATPLGTPNTGYCSGMVKSNNSFEIYFSNTAGAAANMAFDFSVNVI